MAALEAFRTETDTWTGKVHGMTALRKRQAEFIEFREQLDGENPDSVTSIHLVLDNLRMRKRRRVQAWLAKHRQFVFHYPLVHCSWMKQVEQWFNIARRKGLRIPEYRLRCTHVERGLSTTSPGARRERAC
jgi:hypothetical protein